MTVTTTTVRNSYTGDGVTTEFAFTFPVLDAAWVEVLVNGSPATATVTPNLDQSASPGGTVTCLIAPASGAAVEVSREVPLTQETAYSRYAAFPSAAHEAALDKLTMVDQALDGRADELDAGLVEEAAARAGAILAEAALRGSGDAALAAAIAQARADFSAGAGGFGDASAILASGSTTARALNARFGEVFNARDFGCAGDGVTDDYAAMQALVAAVNAAGGGTVVFPNGTYLLDQYKITAGGAANGITDLIFTNCDGLVIEGNGSKLDFKGDFHRAEDAPSASYSQALSLAFVDCASVVVRDLEIDGNVDQMTRDLAVAEGFSYGVYLGGCVGVRLENVFSHHHATDGLKVERSGLITNFKVTRNLAAVGCRFTFNARQGCSITQGRYLAFDDCEFSDQGAAAGTYAGHSPQAGVDIEPKGYPGGGTSDGDDFTGNILFTNCVFRDNGGAEYVGGSNAEVACIHPVTFVSCIFMSTDTGGTPSGSRVAPGTRLTRLLGCHFLEDGVWPFYGGGARDGTCRTEVIGCTFESSNPDARAALAAGGVAGSFIIRDCEFRFTGDAAPALTVYRIYLLNEPYTEFIGNRVWINGAEWLDDGDDRDSKFKLEAIRLAQDNEWDTDLATGAHFFYIAYSTTTVVNEKYKTASRFSPATSAYSPLTYSRRQAEAGELLLGDGLQTYTTRKRVHFGTAAPGSGDYTKGDWVWNSNPSATSPIAWRCTVAGAPGTWVAVQAAAQVDSVAADVATLKNDFNALLAKLRAVGLVAP